jgi:polar amino acid transport system substrate-binding protein
MKKMMALCLVLLFMVGLGVSAYAEDSLAAIQKKGALILGLDDSFPPMGYRDENNEIVGFDIDLAREVCKRLGVELTLQPIDWSAKEMELSSGNIDCIWNGMSHTAEREQSMALSLDYMNNKIVLMVKDAAYKTKDDLSGKIVAVQSGSFAQEVIDSEKNAAFKATLKEVRAYPDYQTAIMDLQNGNVDAVAIDLVVANYRIASSGDTTLSTIGDLEDDLFCIGFRKEDTELRDAVNQALKDMAKDGTLDTICTKWFGSNISIVPQE